MVLKKFGKASMEFTKTGIASSVGASIITSAGGDAKPITNMIQYFPVMGSMVGSGMVLGELKKYKKKY